TRTKTVQNGTIFLIISVLLLGFFIGNFVNNASPGAMQFACIFLFFLATYTHCSERSCLKPFFGYLLSAFLADTIGAVFDSRRALSICRSSSFLLLLC